MFTIDTAKGLGWTISVDEDGRNAHARKGHDAFDVTGDTPLFTTLTVIAEREGQGFLAGRGGDEEKTPELVQAVSGETYEARPPDPVPPPEPPSSFQEAVLQNLAGIDPAAITGTDQLSIAVKDALELTRDRKTAKPDEAAAPDTNARQAQR